MNLPKTEQVTVIGDGGFGTALAMVLHRNGHEVTVWGYEEKTIATIRETRENSIYLPGVPIPEGIQWTSDHAKATDAAKTYVLAIPSKFFTDVCASFHGLIGHADNIVSVAKGMRGFAAYLTPTLSSPPKPVSEVDQSRTPARFTRTMT